MKLIKLKNFLLLFLQYAITTIILYYIFTFINTVELRSSFKTISTTNLIYIFLIAAVIQYLHISRWGYILKSADYKINWMEIVKSYFIGTTAGFISPGQIGEFFARKINLQNQSIAKITVFTFVDKMYLLNSTIFLGAFGIFNFAFAFLNYELKILTGIVLIFAIVISYFFIFTNLLFNLLLKFSSFIKKFSQFEVDKLSEIDFQFPTRLRFFSNTIIINLLIFYQFYFCIKIFSDANIFEVFTGAASVYFLKSFVFFAGIGDLGVREGLSILFFTEYGIPTFVALSASLLIFVFNLLLPALIGVVFLIFHKFKIN